MERSRRTFVPGGVAGLPPVLGTGLSYDVERLHRDVSKVRESLSTSADLASV